MIDFITSLLGETINDYPFLVADLSVILAALVCFMFYTIVASLFKVR